MDLSGTGVHARLLQVRVLTKQRNNAHTVHANRSRDAFQYCAERRRKLYRKEEFERWILTLTFHLSGIPSIVYERAQIFDRTIGNDTRSTFSLMLRNARREIACWIENSRREKVCPQRSDSTRGFPCSRGAGMPERVDSQMGRHRNDKN